MNLNSKIEETVYFMRQEYGNSIDQASIDLVVAKIRQQHRLEKAKEFDRRVASVGKALENIFANVSTLITGRIETL
jgi:hypothetical protein